MGESRVARFLCFAESWLASVLFETRISIFPFGSWGRELAVSGERM